MLWSPIDLTSSRISTFLACIDLSRRAAIYWRCLWVDWGWQHHVWVCLFVFVRERERSKQTLHVPFIFCWWLFTPSQAWSTDPLNEIRHVSLRASPSLTFPTKLLQRSFKMIPEYKRPVPTSVPVWELGSGSQTSAHGTLSPLCRRKVIALGKVNVSGARPDAFS